MSSPGPARRYTVQDYLWSPGPARMSCRRANLEANREPRLSE